MEGREANSHQVVGGGVIILLHKEIEGGPKPTPSPIPKVTHAKILSETGDRRGACHMKN